jgi:hypothetical protein
MHGVPALFLAAVLGLPALPAAADAPRNLEDYVLLGIESAKVGNFGFVDSGNMGVNNAVNGTRRLSGLACGKHVFLREAAVGDKAKMSEGSSVCDLFTNELVSNPASVTIRCSGPTPFSPLPVITPLPPLPVFAPGTTAIRVPTGGSLTLPPGAYGDVLVMKNASLELTGGAYEFANFKTLKYVTVLIDAPSTINVAGILRVSNESTFGPATSSVGPRQIKVNVGGILARFGQDVFAGIDLYAPNATLSFGRKTQMVGRFIGRNNRCDKGATFEHPKCGDSIVDPGEQCDPPGSPSQACGGETCRSDCTCPICGDGAVNQTSEQCDPPGSPSCVSTSPGGGFLDCLPGCKCPVCGDGLLDVPGEECDPPGSLCSNGRSCANDCTCPRPFCGDGFLDAAPPDNEQCDPPGQPTTLCPSGTCGYDCQCPSCGNNVREAGEQCDGTDASACASSHCKPDCTCDPCGDGILDPGEVCDPPGSPSGACLDDFCLPGCVCPVCGDNSVNRQGEQCDGTDDSACPGQCQANCTCAPPSQFCTLTQGAYGAPGGAANGPSGSVTLNPSILPVTVGAPGDLSLTVQDQARLICFLPTGGTPALLCTGLGGCGGDMVINACSNPPILDFDSSGNGSSGGQGGGTLTGQSIAAKLNVALSDLGATPTGLRNFVLPTTLCTTNGTFSISPAIANGVRTVADLIVLADQALRNPSAFNTNDPITRSDVNDALNAINVGFDGCATVCP